MKRCPKLIAWTLPTGLHLLCKEPNQPKDSRKNILVVQAISGGAGSSGYVPMDLGNIVLAALQDAGVQRLPQP